MVARLLAKEKAAGSNPVSRSNFLPCLLSPNNSCKVYLMLSPDLLDYIKDQRAKGVDDNTIRTSLLTAGWVEGDVNMALSQSFTTPATPPAIVTEPTPPPSGRGLHKLLIPLIIIILLVGAAAGAYAYLNIFQSPIKKIEAALKKAEDVKSVVFDGEMKIQVSTDGLLGLPEVQSSRELLGDDTSVLAAKQVTLGLNFDGKVDATDKDKPNYELNVGLDMGAIVPGMSKIEIETRGVAKDFYVRVKDIPQLGIYDLSFLANKWIKADLKDLEKQFSGTSSSTSTLDALESEKLNKIFAKYKVIKEVKSVGSETVNSVETDKFQIVIDKEELIKFYREFYKNIGTLTDTQIEDIMTMFKNMEIQEFDLNLGKKDQMIYRFLLSGTFTDRASSKSKISLLMNFKDYNKPVTIEVPEGAKSFEEIVADFQRVLLRQQDNIYPETLRSTPRPTLQVN